MSPAIQTQVSGGEHSWLLTGGAAALQTEASHGKISVPGAQSQSAPADAPHQNSRAEPSLSELISNAHEKTSYATEKDAGDQANPAGSEHSATAGANTPASTGPSAFWGSSEHQQKTQKMLLNAQHKIWEMRRSTIEECRKIKTDGISNVHTQFLELMAKCAEQDRATCEETLNDLRRNASA